MQANEMDDLSEEAEAQKADLIYQVRFLRPVLAFGNQS
jgi:hypothetical protein